MVKDERTATQLKDVLSLGENVVMDFRYVCYVVCRSIHEYLFDVLFYLLYVYCVHIVKTLYTSHYSRY